MLLDLGRLPINIDLFFLLGIIVIIIINVLEILSDFCLIFKLIILN